MAKDGDMTETPPCKRVRTPSLNQFESVSGQCLLNLWMIPCISFGSYSILCDARPVLPQHQRVQGPNARTWTDVGLVSLHNQITSDCILISWGFTLTSWSHNFPYYDTHRYPFVSWQFASKSIHAKGTPFGSTLCHTLCFPNGFQHAAMPQPQGLLSFQE